MKVRTVAAASLALGMAGAAAATDTLYRFVDEDGVIHFSNVPNDARYVAVRRLISNRVVRRASWGPRNIRAYDSVIEQAAENHGVPPALVKAVIAAESDFNPRAVSPKGAQGLMQLMPDTQAFLGVEDPYQAEENVKAGTRYLAGLLERYGDWSHALAAYNAGPQAVDRYRGIPPFPETREYVDRVLAYYRRYHAEFDR